MLSGGGALGCAHLGVQDFLESHNLVPGNVAGTSMGALVGAGIACGFSASDIAGYFARVARLTSWVRLSWTRPGMLDTDKISTLLTDIFEERTFSDTNVPFSAAATDFESGEVRIFSAEDNVRLRDGLLCSMSVPVVFPPVELDGRKYVDGFLGANLPIEAVGDNDERVIAVDVMSRKSLPEIDADGSLFQRAKFLTRAYDRAFYMLVQNQTRNALLNRDNVLLIEPELSEFRVYSFDQWERMRDLGRIAAKETLSPGDS